MGKKKATDLATGTLRYEVVQHDVDADKGTPLFVRLSAHASDLDAQRALKDLASVNDLSTEVFSIIRVLHSGLKPATRQRTTVKLEGLEPSRKRKPKALAPIEESLNA